MANNLPTIGSDFEERFKRARTKAMQHVLSSVEFQMMEALTPKKIPAAMALLNKEMDKKEEHMRSQIYQQIMTQNDFVECCKRAGIIPSIRQASKFYKGEGAAWAEFIKLVDAIELTINETSEDNESGDSNTNNG